MEIDPPRAQHSAWALPAFLPWTRAHGTMGQSMAQAMMLFAVAVQANPRLRLGASCLADCAGSSDPAVIDVSFAGTPGQWPVTESISMEFVGVPSSCVNVAIGTPCAASAGPCLSTC